MTSRGDTESLKYALPLSRVKYCPDAPLQVCLQAVQSEQYFRSEKAHSHQSANGGLMTARPAEEEAKSLSRCTAASLLASGAVWAFLGAKAPQSSKRQQRFDDCCRGEEEAKVCPDAPLQEFTCKRSNLDSIFRAKGPQSSKAPTAV